MRIKHQCTLWVTLLAMLAGCTERHAPSLRINYYPNGVIRSKGPVERGVHSGTWQYYYSDGTPRWEGKLKNGRRDKYNLESIELEFTSDTVCRFGTVGLKIRNVIIDDLYYSTNFAGQIDQFIDCDEMSYSCRDDLYLSPIHEGWHLVRITLLKDANGVDFPEKPSFSKRLYVTPPCFTGREDRIISIGNYMSGDTVGRDIMFHEDGYKVMQYYCVDSDKARDDTLYLPEGLPPPTVDFKATRRGCIIRQRYYKQDETAKNAD